MNSKLKMGLKGVVIGAAIQSVAIPVMAEEIHGKIDQNDNFSLRIDSYKNYPLGGELNVAIGTPNDWSCARYRQPMLI